MSIILFHGDVRKMSILIYLKKKRKRNLELGRLDDTIFVLEKWHTQTVQTQLRLPLRLTD